MTTLFPQIKRVSEDETSKIIKNVLFSDQDECKLEQIFEEFTHLTKETITSSDVEDEAEDSDNNRNDDEDDGEDGDEDDDGSGCSGASGSSGSSESTDSTDSSDSDEDVAKSPISWNLDQFIHSISNTPAAQTAVAQPPIKAEPIKAPSTKTVQAPSGSCIVQIELSKLKRIPGSKTPTPAPITAPNVVTTPTPVPTPIITANPVSAPTPTQAPTPAPAASVSSNTLVTGKAPTQAASVAASLVTAKAPTPTTSVTSNTIVTAKALKHEADAEKDKTKQMIKYLEASMYFVLHGYEMELANNNTVYYHDTIPLFKHVIRLSAPDNVTNPDNMTNVKIHALALRCLSVLHFRLYKLQERSLQDAAKTIHQHSQNSPIQQVDGLMVGIRPQLFNAYRKQSAIFNELRNAHDKWHSVEHLCDLHPALRIFFSTIESNCGPLTMVSSFSKLMEHVKCGLKLLRTN